MSLYAVVVLVDAESETDAYKRMEFLLGLDEVRSVFYGVPVKQGEPLEISLKIGTLA